MSSVFVFGAGKFGMEAMQQLKYKNYDKRYFCDNNTKIQERYIQNIQVISFETMKSICSEEDEVIVASVHWMEMRRQCLCNGVKINGYYSWKEKTVLSLKDFCKSVKHPYENEAYVWEQLEIEQRILRNKNKFLAGAKLSECISEVHIMISNLCNYAILHKKCPASEITCKEIMSLEKFKCIINQLKEMEFGNEGERLCFHIYNEPMIDPRLYWMIDYAKKELVGIRILVYSNGYYLNQVMADEMQNVFADIVVVTAYGEEEMKRLTELKFDIPYRVLYGVLDDRMEMKKDSVKSESPCLALFSEVNIYVNGDIGICCLDYQHKESLGNVFENSLRKCLDKNENRYIQMELLKGNRQVHSICSCCNWQGNNV